MEYVYDFGSYELAVIAYMLEDTNWLLWQVGSRE
jgi:hypothetical protein